MFEEKPGQDINKIVNQMISGLEQNKLNVSKFKNLDLLNIKNPYNPLEFIINDFNIIKNNDFNISGVDSGFVSKQFSFSNITIVKEVGCVFNYKDGKLNNTKYYPKIYNRAKPYLTSSSAQLEEIMWNSSILRLNKEVNLTSSIIKDQKEDLDASLIDGSLIPQYINKPTKECKAKQQYNKMIFNFLKLYDLAKKNNVFLIGCIEDCRGQRFFDFLKNQIITNDNILLKEQFDFQIYDSYLSFSLLEKNQRTCVFKYSEDVKHHPILKDFPKTITDNLYCCYLKLSEHDYPLRIEFIYFKEFGLSLLDYTNKIIDIISSTSYFNKNYTYPAPLIEADIRSRLKLDEISMITNNILEKTKVYGYNLLRRENRIF